MSIHDDLFAALCSAAEHLKGTSVEAGPRAMQRGFADVIESYVSEKVRFAVENDFGLLTAPARSRRSIEDFAVRKGGLTTWVDVKTKDTDGTFSMPNLISIQRLWKIFEAKAEDLVFIFVDYTIVDRDCGIALLDRVLCVAAESMNPEVLQIQNLGLGQIQMRGDASSTDLLATYGGQSLRRALPGMAVDFHLRQAEKSRREARIWASRTQA